MRKPRTCNPQKLLYLLKWRVLFYRNLNSMNVNSYFHQTTVAIQDAVLREPSPPSSHAFEPVSIMNSGQFDAFSLHLNNVPRPSFTSVPRSNSNISQLRPRSVTKKYLPHNRSCQYSCRIKVFQVVSQFFLSSQNCTFWPRQFHPVHLGENRCVSLGNIYNSTRWLTYRW